MENFISNIFSRNKEKEIEHLANLQKTEDEAIKKLITYIEKNEGKEVAQAMRKGQLSVSDLRQMGIGFLIRTSRYFYVNENGVEETETKTEEEILNNLDI